MLFVIADRGLDCEDYNQEKTDITWEGSMLRDWLNSTFYHTAFSSGEQKAVVGQTAENEANPEYGTEDKGKANDKVTLLSMEDAANPSYGFCEEDGTDSATRRMEPSDYARARGTFISSGEHAGGCWWWLRSLGYDATYAVDVSDYGYILSYGSNISTSSNAVVPALHIDLASGLWSLADAESGAAQSIIGIKAWWRKPQPARKMASRCIPARYAKRQGKKRLGAFPIPMKLL
jgi:hypothetical protein